MQVTRCNRIPKRGLCRSTLLSQTSTVHSRPVRRASTASGRLRVCSAIALPTLCDAGRMPSVTGRFPRLVGNLIEVMSTPDSTDPRKSDISGPFVSSIRIVYDQACYVRVQTRRCHGVVRGTGSTREKTKRPSYHVKESGRCISVHTVTDTVLLCARYVQYLGVKVHGSVQC